MREISGPGAAGTRMVDTLFTLANTPPSLETVVFISRPDTFPMQGQLTILTG